MHTHAPVCHPLQAKERVISLVNSCDDESWTPLIVACVRPDDTGMVKVRVVFVHRVLHVE